MILNDGTEWSPEPEQIAKWKELYPAVDVEQELRAMDGWSDANPKKRKTLRGVARFCNSWLQRAQNQGGSPMAKGLGTLGTPQNRITRSRDMTSLDELTHDFNDCAQFRHDCLVKYGQYFKDGVRYTT